MPNRRRKCACTRVCVCIFFCYFFFYFLLTVTRNRQCVTTEIVFDPEFPDTTSIETRSTDRVSFSCGTPSLNLKILRKTRRDHICLPVFLFYFFFFLDENVNVATATAYSAATCPCRPYVLLCRGFLASPSGRTRIFHSRFPERNRTRDIRAQTHVQLYTCVQTHCSISTIRIVDEQRIISKSCYSRYY